MISCIFLTAATPHPGGRLPVEIRNSRTASQNAEAVDESFANGSHVALSDGAQIVTGKIVELGPHRVIRMEGAPIYVCDAVVEVSGTNG